MYGERSILYFSLTVESPTFKDINKIIIKKQELIRCQ